MPESLQLPGRRVNLYTHQWSLSGYKILDGRCVPGTCPLRVS